MVDIFGAIGGAVGGIGSAVGSYLTQPAAAPGQTTDEYAMPSTPATMPSAVVEPSIPPSQTVVTGSRDESGEYRPVSTDTSQPAQQTFVERYVEPTQEITRADYTPMAKLGDTQTQAYIKQGYSPEQALSMQIDKERAEGDTHAARYYQGELDKALESKIGLSSAYHTSAQESGLPQAPNPFEYVGDLSKQLLYKSAGVSNVPGTGLQPQYQGSLAKDVNILTKAARTGEMGDYGNLGKPFSSGYGVLSLATQQAIGREAAETAREKGIGWDVNEHAMDRFTPELKKSAGFDLFYTPIAEGGSESTFGLVPLKSLGAGTKEDKIINIELESGDVIQRKASDYDNLGFLGGLINKEPTPRPTITGEIKSPGITKGTINEYLLPEDMVDIGGRVTGTEKTTATANIIKTTEGLPSGIVDTSMLARGTNVVATRREPVKSVIDTRLYATGLGTPEIDVGGMKIGGRFGSGETMGGLTMENIGIQPLYRPPGMGPLTLRKAKKSKPSAQRKSIHVRKPDPQILHLESLEKQVIPNTLGKGLLKIKVGNPNVLIKSLGARTSVKAKTIKGMARDVKIPEIEMKGVKKKSDVSGNITTILDGITRTVKSNKK